jgi:EAL domain-containing protein (putative c-di-GMP-specific phosphodiesterase class I)
VKATIGLARELKLDVIAEGVENAKQLALLPSWGCRAAQGFYFAKPMAAEQVEPLLRKGMIHPIEPLAATGRCGSEKVRLGSPRLPR